MLFVDYRLGSIELLKPLCAMGLPAEEADIPADIFIEGRGEGGAPVLVGIEFKKLGELVQSLRTQRLQGHQLLKMRHTFDFSYLLVEGELLYDATGTLQKRSGRRQFRPLPGRMALGELYKRLFVLHLRGGLHLLPFARTRQDTLRCLEALYHTWTDCDLDQHKSHIAIYQPAPLVPISEFRQFFTRIEGVGFKASAAIEKYFDRSIKKAVLAPRAEWLKIEGIGDKLATHIVEVMGGIV